MSEETNSVKLYPSTIVTTKLKSLRLRILIVEDDPIMRIGLKQLLSSQPQQFQLAIAMSAK